MTTLKSNVTFSCNDKDLNPEIKLCTLYTDEEYDKVKFGKCVSIYDTGVKVIDAMEEMFSTNLPPEYMEEGIDGGLREFVRLVHANVQCDVTQEQLDNFDDLSDVMSINLYKKDKKHFAKLGKTCEGDTLIVSEMHASPLVGTKKLGELQKEATCPFSYLSNFFEETFDEEECTNDDAINANRVSEYFNKKKKQEHQMKMLRREIKLLRTQYKKSYALMEKYEAVGLTDYAIMHKAKGDEAYKLYLKYSKAMDKINELDAKAKEQRKQKEIDTLRHMFIELQQKCPDKYVDSVSTEELNEKYKTKGYEVTKTWLARLIKRADDLNARAEAEETEETA